MKLHSNVTGEGKDLVLLTGLAGSTRYWDHMMPTFLASGYRVIRLDLVGFGQSPQPRNITHDLETHTAAILDTLQRIGVKDATIVGYSMSGSLALHLGAEYPELFSRVVMLCPSVYSSLEAADNLAYETGDLPRWLLDSIYAELFCRIVCNKKYIALPIYRIFAYRVPKVARDDARLHHWLSYRESLDNLIINYRPAKDIAKLTIPTLVVYGTADDSAEKPFLSRLKKLNRNFTVVSIAGGHHQLPIQFPERISEFIVHPPGVTS